MNCPWCRASLDLVTLGPVTVDHCPTCGAQWFDRTELAAVLNAEAPGLAVDWGRPVPEAELGGWPRCPRDQGDLIAHRWLGVEFGRCARCRGVLLSDASWNQLLQAARLRADASADHVAAFDLIGMVAEVLAFWHH
jgi:Zn-finger nucleic acid-binding protein